ncbi:MAG: TolC family protein [Phycisphaerales bacterium]|nr:TolC family protein [Phycisphaerales bacterium]
MTANPANRRSRCNLVLSLGLAGALAATAGCGSGMDQIDRRLAKVLGESSGRTGLAVDPRIQPAQAVPARSGSLYETSPATNNPAAAELAYTELDRGQPGTPAVVQGLNERLRNYGLAAGGIGAENVLTLSLLDSLRLAQRQGREYVSAEEDYIIGAISLLAERHRWGPRLFADSSVSVGGDGDEGRFDNALNVVNTLRATHRLPYGGEAEARWVWNATEQLRSSVSGQYQQASSLVLDTSLPLLRGAGMVAREDIIQAERDLVYAARDFEAFRRSYFVSIAQDYFRLLQTVNELQNRLVQLGNLEVFVQQEHTLKEAGRRTDFQVNEARDRLVSARSSLASTREQFTLQLDRFKIRLGIPVQQPLRLVGAAIQIPEPSTTIEDATISALAYRLDLQNRRDRYADSQRGVLAARNQLLPDLDLSGEVRIPTDPGVSEGGLAIDPDEASWEAGLLLSLPLDRRIERLQLRQSLLRLQQSQRDLDEFVDTVIVDARQSVRAIDLARFRLELAESQVQINDRRLEQQKIDADRVDTRDRLDAEARMLDAKNARDQALTDLRIAILTYLDSIGQLRVSPEGVIDPLPGMTIQVEDRPIDFEKLLSVDQLTAGEGWGMDESMPEAPEGE